MIEENVYSDCDVKHSTSGLTIKKNVNTESYMNVHVLLNVLNKLRKRDKMQGLPSFFLSLFPQ